MKAKDALKTQYHLFYLTMKMNLDGMSADDALRQPEPGGNCANWIVAHLVAVQNAVMGLVNAAPVWDHEGLETSGDAITSADQAFDWDVMVAKLLQSEDRFMEAMDGLSDEDLDQGGFADPFGNAVTRGELLNFLAMHQNYHGGQVALSRRLAGLEGAIRGPG